MTQAVNEGGTEGGGFSSRVSQAVASGQGVNVRELATRAGISTSEISANDLVGILGGVLVFISFFVSTVTSPDGSASLSSDGGFIGALVPTFSALAAISLVVPRVRRFGSIGLAISAVAMGIGVGSVAFLSQLAGAGVHRGAGWYLCLLGGLLLIYGWVMRAGLINE